MSSMHSGSLFGKSNYGILLYSKLKLQLQQQIDITYRSSFIWTIFKKELFDVNAILAKSVWVFQESFNMYTNHVKLFHRKTFTHLRHWLNHCAWLTKSYDLAIENNCLTNWLNVSVNSHRNIYLLSQCICVFGSWF